MTKTTVSANPEVNNVGKLLPNDAKSIEGEWYEYPAKFKIERITKQSDVDDTAKYRKYKVTVTFPTEHHVGIAFDQLELTSNNKKDHDWSGFWYRMHSEDVPQELQRLIGIVNDLRRENKFIRERNRALEKHFSLTAFEQQQQEMKRHEEKPSCDYCYETIDKSKIIEGKDWISLEDGDVHLDCAVKMFRYQCKKCGMLWGEDNDDEGCPECEGTLELINANQVREALTFNVLKRYLPKELHDKVAILEPKTTHSKEKSTK